MEFGKRGEKFFGETKRASNKYFFFNHIINNDTILIVTDDIRKIKTSFVLMVGNDKAVYLKDWQLAHVTTKESGETYAIRLNRNFFKVYTFRTPFEDAMFEHEQSFDDLAKIAERQNAVEIHDGWTM